MTESLVATPDFGDDSAEAGDESHSGLHSGVEPQRTWYSFVEFTATGQVDLVLLQTWLEDTCGTDVHGLGSVSARIDDDDAGNGDCWRVAVIVEHG
ncbi:hypothetical protein CEP51_016594, partial [Fusarium floridanum]